MTPLLEKERIQLSIAVASATLLVGCASVPRRTFDFQPPRKVRVAVLPMRLTAPIRRLREVQSAPPPVGADESSLLSERVDAVMKDLMGTFEEQMGRSYLFDVIADSDVGKALRELGHRASTAPLSSEELRRLGPALGSPVFLELRLAGYGKIKRKWLFYLVGSGMVEAAVEGAVVAEATHSPWLGAAVAAEEAIQETLTWGGGIFFFDRFFTPVVVEGEMRDAGGAVLWKNSVSRARASGLLKDVPSTERKKREVRLRLVAERSVRNLERSLEDEAWRHSRRPRNH